MKKHFAHPTALVESDQIGADTRIWAFAHILKDVVIGENCNIGDHCFIENGVRIGNSVVIKNGVSVWTGVTLESHVFVGPNAVFTNDLTPRAKVRRAEIPTQIQEGASIGANATIRCGITIGRWSMIGAGTVVTHPIPDFALIIGVPGRQKGWVCVCGSPLKLPVQGQGKETCACNRTYRLFKDHLEVL